MKKLLLVLVVSAPLGSVFPISVVPVAEAGAAKENASRQEAGDAVRYVPKRWLFAKEDVSPFGLTDPYSIQLQCLNSQGYVFSHSERIKAKGSSQGWRRAPFNNGEPVWSVWLYNGCQNIQIVPVDPTPGWVGPWVQVWVLRRTPEPEPVFCKDPAEVYEKREKHVQQSVLVPSGVPVPPVPQGTPCTGPYDIIHLGSLKRYERQVFWKPYDNIWLNCSQKHFYQQLGLQGPITNI
jgi:hypothetical protein